MSMPANDPVSFGLAHDSHRRPRMSTRSRSSSYSKFSFPSSPKLSFVTPGDGKTMLRNAQQGPRRPLETNGSLAEELLNDSHDPRTPPRLYSEPSKLPEDAKPIDWEIPRKILHSSIGFFSLYLYVSRGSSRNVVVVLCTALAVIVPADVLRLRSPGFARVYEKCLGFLMRESEKKTTNGVIWYIIGVVLVLGFLPLDIATVSILILSWADTAASTFGRYFASRSPRLPRRLPLLQLPLAPRKSLAGFIAASVTGACIAIGFWRWVAPCRPNDLSWSWDSGITQQFASSPGGFGKAISDRGFQAGGWLGLITIGLVAGLVSGVAEALDVGSMDDNLTLPVISGACLWGFFKMIGFFS